LDLISTKLHANYARIINLHVNVISVITKPLVVNVAQPVKKHHLNVINVTIAGIIKNSVIVVYIVIK
jgi:hypothetical protein